jgi:predicted Zn-dependent protease with MMP-like domain
MFLVSNEQFQQLIDQALGKLPKEHVEHIKNVAILYEEQPTPEQRIKLQLRNDQTLFGLYEGVPLSRRQGELRMIPDTITLFKYPICAVANTMQELEEQIIHTLWHEIAHYYGLNHSQIKDLENT